MREIREVQLGLLRSFDEICRAHGIVYYLSDGTLLGAVRHRGYIPWDDDIDLMMARDQLPRLRAALARSSGAEGLRLLEPETVPDWPYHFAKLSDVRTEVREQVRDAPAMGVNIDIWPLDRVPRRAVPRAWFLLRVRFWGSLLDLRRWVPSTRRGWRVVAARSIGTVLAKIPVDVLVRAYRRAATSRASDAGAYLGSVYRGLRKPTWACEPCELGSDASAEFEGALYPVPQNADAVLRSLYDDYTQEVPVEQQVPPHRFDAFWRSGRPAA